MRKEHSRLMSLFRDCLREKKDPKARLNVWRDLRREITRHILLVEDVLYPQLKSSPATAPLAKLGAVHNGIVDRMVRRLEGSPCNTRAWEKMLRDLRSLITSHMRMQEAELRILIPKVFNQKDLGLLGGKLKALVAAA